MKTAVLRIDPPTAGKGYPIQIAVEDGAGTWWERPLLQHELPAKLETFDPVKDDQGHDVPAAELTLEKLRATLLNEKEASPDSCDWPWHGPYISYRGLAMPCCMIATPII